MRATIDVDVIFEVTTLARYHWFSNQLRQLGFIEDTSGGAPICRWISGGAILDVMPTDPEILGFGNLWFTPAYQASEWVIVPNRGRKA